MTRYDELPALMARMSGDEKHDASSESTLDVIWTLYDRVLDVAPDRVDDPDRDRFLLSKGHGPMAYYAVLAAKGFLDPERAGHLGRASTPGSATTRTASGSRASRSPRARWVTASGSVSARRWAWACRVAAVLGWSS